jgi:hypothetical protein
MAARAAADQAKPADIAFNLVERVESQSGVYGRPRIEPTLVGVLKSMAFPTRPPISRPRPENRTTQIVA